MVAKTQEELDEAAARVGVDLKRHRVCARCEQPLKGKRTLICDGAPYAGRRLDADCIKALLADDIGDEGAEES